MKMTKSELRKNVEIRIPKRRFSEHVRLLIRASSFGFLSEFGIRHSDILCHPSFGFES